MAPPSGGVTALIRNQASTRAKARDPTAAGGQEHPRIAVSSNDFRGHGVGSDHDGSRRAARPGGPARRCGSPSSRHALAAFAVIVAANGWVASTTASTGESANHRCSPSTPPKPPMRTVADGQRRIGHPARQGTDHLARRDAAATPVPAPPRCRPAAVAEPRSVPASAPPVRRVQITVGEALGGQDVADDDDRRAGDLGRVHPLGEVAERAPAAPSPAASSRMPRPHREFPRDIHRRSVPARSRRPARPPGAAPAWRPAPTACAGPRPAASPSTASPPWSTSRSGPRRGRSTRGRARRPRRRRPARLARSRSPPPARRGGGTARPARCRSTGHRSAGARRPTRRRRHRRVRRRSVPATVARCRSPSRRADTAPAGRRA